MMNSDGTTPLNTTGTVVFDLDGVVYVGSEGVPGARAALESIEDSGRQLIFATNNSTKTPEHVISQIEERTGYRNDEAIVVTSAMAAAALAKVHHRRAFVIGEQGLVDTLVTSGIEVVDDATADCVIVGLDRDITYGKIDVASRLVRAGATFIATNTDVTFPTPSGPSPGAGTIVAAVTAASGTEPVACGKPHVPMLTLIRDQLTSNDVVVVGDRPDTDLAMARRAGWTAVLVLTGVTGPDDPITPDHAPHHVLPSLADLPELLGL